MGFKRMTRQGPFWLSMLMVAGCSNWAIDEINLFDYRDVAVPLFHSEFTLPEALMDGQQEVLILPDGSIALEYSGQEVALQSSDFIPVLPVGIPIPLPDTISQIAIPTTAGLTIQQVKFKQTRFTLSIKYQSEQPLTFVLEVPQANLDGQTWYQSFTLPVQPNAATWQSPVIDLDGITVQMPSGEIVLKYRINGAVQPAGLSVFATFSSIDFYEVSGQFARMNQTIPAGELPIDVFAEWTGGDIEVVGPELIVTVRNSFGIPVNLEINQLAVVDEQGSVSDLETTEVPASLAIAYPPIDEIGATKSTVIDINRDNSNIEALIRERPVKVVYQVHGVINPDQINGPFYALDSSQVQIDSRLRIPLSGSLAAYQDQDTFPMAIPEYEGIQEAFVHWTTTSEVPLDLSLLAEIYDKQNQKIGNLWEGWQEIATGAVQGDVSKNQIDLPIAPTILDALPSATYLVIHYQLKTTADQPVKVYADQRINCEVGLKLKIARG